MMMSKYSANGNDFVIFHAFEKKDRTDLAIKLCNRQEGIGADGLIVIIPHDKYDFQWEFYNSDGSVANMCGNGSRAAAHYAFVNDIVDKKMKFLTGAGVIHAEISKSHGDKKGMVLSELTPPVVLDKIIEINNKSWWLIDTGVAHLVSFTQNIQEFDIQEARELRYKYDANVNIVYVDENKNLKVRTYERGVEDETLACGTGMAACFYRALMEEKVSGNIEVYPKSGDTLYLGMNDRTITFKGEVKNVFNTTI
jgi:diaminopimelate epimerase